MSTTTLTESSPKKIDTVKFKMPAMMIKPAAVVRWAFPPLLGLMLFVFAWAVLSHFRTELPGPVSTWHSAVELFADPFYNNGLCTRQK